MTEVLKVLGAGRYRGGTGTPRYGTGVLRYCGCSVLMRHRARADPEISLSGGGRDPELDPETGNTYTRPPTEIGRGTVQFRVYKSRETLASLGL